MYQLIRDMRTAGCGIVLDTYVLMTEGIRLLRPLARDYQLKVAVETYSIFGGEPSVISTQRIRLALSWECFFSNVRTRMSPLEATATLLAPSLQVRLSVYSLGSR